MNIPTWYQKWLKPAMDVNALQVFFVVGCQKSGTTWLQQMLHAHPTVACLGEGHMADVLLSTMQLAFSQYNTAQKGRAGQPALLHYRDLQSLIKLLTDKTLSKYVHTKPNPAVVKAVGDKTPEHALTLPLLNTLYPAGKFIHIIRDGRDGAVSGWAHVQRDNNAGRFPTFADYAEYFAQHHWKLYIQNARDSAKAWPDRYMEVRYEDVHANPIDAARDMLRFINVDSNDEIVEQCVSAAKFEKLSGGRSPGQEDRSSHFRKGVVGDWREHFDDAALDRFNTHAGDLLNSLGY